jgi:hypothetical protein
VLVEDAINSGPGERGDGAGRLGSEETAVCCFVFSAIETKGSKPGLDSEDSFSWTPHDGPMDSVYEDGGEILGVVIELSTILELEVPDDDERLFPRLACSQASDDRKEIFKFSLSLIVKYSSERRLL